MKNKWVQGILFTCMFVLFPPSATSYALSCMPVPDPFEVYDVLVMGEVTNVDEHSSLLAAYKQVDLNIASSWKDKLPSEISFHTDFTWGHDFKIGNSYLLYLNKTENGRWQQDVCSEVRMVDETFDESALPPGAFESIPEKDNSKLLFLIVGIVGVIASIGAIRLLRSNRKDKKLPKNKK